MNDRILERERERERERPESVGARENCRENRSEKSPSFVLIDFSGSRSYCRTTHRRALL